MATEKPPSHRDLVSVASAVSELVPRFSRGRAVRNLRPGGGNAGFSYLFDVDGPVGIEQYFLRLAPPGARRVGTADVFRQSVALRALDRTDVPHPRILDEGQHPVVGDYLVTSVVPGRNLGGEGSFDGATRAQLGAMAAGAISALAGVHSVAPGPELAYLGDFGGHADLVARWDRFVERGEYADRMRDEQQEARRLLLARLPDASRLSLTHGDFQFGNLMYTEGGTLTAVIDWELCDVAPALADLGWLMAFHDAAAWGSVPRPSAAHFAAEDFRRRYEQEAGSAEGVEWFQALAHYKYAVIASLNLALHRRGKREDPEWERRGPGALTNLTHALRLLRSL